MASDYKELGKRLVAAISHKPNSARATWMAIARELLDYLNTSWHLADIFGLKIVTNATYTVPDDDYLVFVETYNVVSTRVVYLPDPPTAGRFVIVKDIGGYANTQNVDIDPGAKLVDGSTSHPVIDENYGSIILVYNGQEWSVIGGGGVSGGGGGGGIPFFEEFAISGPGDDTYTVSNVPEAATVRVMLNGLQLQTDEYSVSGSDVTVSHTIAAGDEVAIIYYV